MAGLILLNVTNGTKAAKRLSNERYFTALDTCAKGGMEAVATLPRYKELCVKNPDNRMRLAAMDPARFMTQHKMWGDFLARGGATTDFPVTGLHVRARPTGHRGLMLALTCSLLQADFLKRVKQPALCIYVVDAGGKDDVRCAGEPLRRAVDSRACW